MALFNRFPFSNAHELNLDWILRVWNTLRGGNTNQVLAKRSNADFDFQWVSGGGGGGTDDYNDLNNKPQINGNTLTGNNTTSQLGITIPSASSATPQPLGTAAAGSSSDYSRADHVHAKPTVADIGAAAAVEEITVSASGDVVRLMSAGKIYHFTGTLTSLSVALDTPGTGELAQYHFDFDSGSTAPTLTVSGATVYWPGGSFTPEASKHYEVDILNGYGVYQAW